MGDRLGTKALLALHNITTGEVKIGCVDGTE